MSGLRLLALLALLAGAVSALALQADEILADPALEQRARALSKQLRCMVCQNQSIFDSNAGLARDLRRVVRERVSSGDSDAQVIAWIRERYGDYVLLEPPVAGHTAVLWLAPLALVTLALLSAWRYLRGRRGPSGDDEETRAGRRLLEESSR